MAAHAEMALHLTASQAFLLADEFGSAAPGTIVLAGDADAISSVRSSLPVTEIILDYAGWESTFVEPGTPPSSLPDESTLFDLNVERFSAFALEAGADRVLYPTRAIPRVSPDLLRAQLESMAHSAQLIPHLVVPHTALSGNFFELLTGTLEKVGRPVALTTFGEPATIARNERLANLRYLAASGLIGWYFATDPVLAIDIAAHGATSSVGASSRYRVPRRPGSRPPFSASRAPALFFRHILETRSASIVADWYAGLGIASLRCPRCGDVVLLDSSKEDRARAIFHNIHAFVDLSIEFNEVDPIQRAAWVREARLQALAEHPTRALALQSTTPILNGLLSLDGDVRDEALEY